MVMFDSIPPWPTKVVTACAELGVLGLNVDDEGVTWIRGRHEADSEEARALLASYAIMHGGKK